MRQVSRDTTEESVLTRSNGQVTRDGLTLAMKLRNGNVARLSDDTTEGGSAVAYRYDGHLTHVPFHGVRMTFYEGHGYLLVHDSTGRHTALDRKPEIAPGGARLATANSDLWAQFDANRIAISRVAGDTVVAEWQVTPTSWGPSNPHWVGDDTIRFTQEWSTTQPDSFIVRTAFLVRSPEAWQLVEPAGAPPGAHSAWAVPDTVAARAPVPPAAASVDSGGRMDDCPPPQSAGLKISEHCIGPIAWDSTLGNIRRHFPKPLESLTYLRTFRIAIWRFAFGPATVVASQQDDRMNPNRPADYWIVSGEGIVLPGGGILPEWWGDFRKAYPHGLGISISELGIEADNCQMPGLSFMLSLPTWLWPATLDPDSVPSGARIDRVLLDRAHPPSDSLVPC